MCKNRLMFFSKHDDDKVSFNDIFVSVISKCESPFISFFYCYLAAPWPILGQQSHKPDVNLCFLTGNLVARLSQVSKRPKLQSAVSNGIY